MKTNSLPLLPKFGRIRSLLMAFVVMVTSMNAVAQWSNSVTFSVARPSLIRPRMKTFINPYGQNSQGFAAMAGIATEHISSSTQTLWGIAAHLGYRRLDYNGYHFHSSGSDDWKFKGDFVELYGSIFAKVRLAPKSQTYFCIAGMPELNIWGNYRQYIDHNDYTPPYGNYFEDQRYHYVLDHIGFRVMAGIEMRMLENLRWQWYVMPGITSHASTVDFGFSFQYYLHKDDQANKRIAPEE